MNIFGTMPLNLSSANKTRLPEVEGGEISSARRMTRRKRPRARAVRPEPLDKYLKFLGAPSWTHFELTFVPLLTKSIILSIC